MILVFRKPLEVGLSGESFASKSNATEATENVRANAVNASIEAADWTEPPAIGPSRAAVNGGGGAAGARIYRPAIRVRWELAKWLRQVVRHCGLFSGLEASRLGA